MLKRLRQSEVIKNSRLLLMGALVAQALPVAASPLLTRMYSPEEMGLWGTYTSIVLTLGTFAALRLDVAIVMAREESAARSLYRTATRSSLIVCLAVTAVCLVLSDTLLEVLNAESLGFWLFLVGANVFALGQFQLLGYWLNRKSEYKLISRSRAGQSAVTTATQVSLGAFGSGVGGLISGTLAGYGVGAFVLWLRERRNLHTGARGQSSGAVLRQHWRMPVLNGVGAIADAVRMNGMNIAIAVHFSQNALGVFTLAWRSVFLPVTLLSASVSQVFYQRFANTPSGGLTRLATRCMLLCAGVGLVPFSILGLWGGPLFSAIFGHEWAISGTLAQYMTPYLYLAFVSSPLASVFLVTNRQALLMIFSILYMSSALLVIGAFPGSLIAAIQLFGIIMAATMLIFLALAVLVCRNYDKLSREDDESMARPVS